MSISSDILARYAADAAREIEGVNGLVESHLHRHRGVRVLRENGAVRIEIHVEAEWGASLPEVGKRCADVLHLDLGAVDPEKPIDSNAHANALAQFQKARNLYDSLNGQVQLARSKRAALLAQLDALPGR